MKIQIVEDNRDLQAIFEGLFVAAGHDVKVSGDGLNGITDAVDYRPDVILLDIMMPEMSGYDFLGALRNNTSIDPFVIVCSNLSQQADIDKAMALGANNYLRKSDYVGDELLKAVEQLYQEHQAGGAQTHA